MLDGYKLVVESLEDPGELIELGDYFRNAFKVKGVSLIGTVQNNKPMVMCAITDDLTSIIQAGSIVKEIGAIMGGGGGGKPHIATAGGSDISLLQDALVHGKNLIKNILGQKNV
jgi:alanyl-tRNA synthetase